MEESHLDKIKGIYKSLECGKTHKHSLDSKQYCKTIAFLVLHGPEQNPRQFPKLCLLVVTIQTPAVGESRHAVEVSSASCIMWPWRWDCTLGFHRDGIMQEWGGEKNIRLVEKQFGEQG